MSQQGGKPTGHEDDWWDQLYDDSTEDTRPTPTPDSLDDRYASAADAVEGRSGARGEPKDAIPAPRSGPDGFRERGGPGTGLAARAVPAPSAEPPASPSAPWEPPPDPPPGPATVPPGPKPPGLAERERDPEGREDVEKGPHTSPEPPAPTAPPSQGLVDTPRGSRIPEDTTANSRPPTDSRPPGQTPPTPPDPPPLPTAPPPPPPPFAPPFPTAPPTRGAAGPAPAEASDTDPDTDPDIGTRPDTVPDAGPDRDVPATDIPGAPPLAAPASQPRPWESPGASHDGDAPPPAYPPTPGLPWGPPGVPAPASAPADGDARSATSVGPERDAAKESPTVGPPPLATPPIGSPPLGAPWGPPRPQASADADTEPRPATPAGPERDAAEVSPAVGSPPLAADNPPSAATNTGAGSLRDDSPGPGREQPGRAPGPDTASDPRETRVDMPLVPPEPVGHVGSGPPTYEAEPTALPPADPDDLDELVADTVLDGARYGACTLRAASVRGDSARFRGEPRRDSLLTARFGTGDRALVLVAMATGARATSGAHRAAAEACHWIGRAVGRSHARLAEDITAGRRGDLKSGLHRLTDRSLGKLRASAAEQGIAPEEYAATLRCLLLPADPDCRIRVFFGIGDGGLFRLRDGVWHDIEPRVLDVTGEPVVGFGSPPAETPDGDRLTMDLGIPTPPSPYEPAPEPPREPFRFRASIARPGDTLLMCTGGLAEPLRGEPELGRYLTGRWSDPTPPGLAAFLADAQVRVKGYADDRTAAAVWEA
ncbi:protein phosphatase 2C domain-containing protein [Streptomyces sp. NPDC006332]|uniref:protein phosphatase 2C domain-containing protein n=1 Tax=Streptomyces sp. NPDC006332 TaxID=3155456 RepID=UPI0033AF8524